MYVSPEKWLLWLPWLPYADFGVGSFLCASYLLNFQSLPHNSPFFCPLRVQFLFTSSRFLLADPRGPTFAEIHARGRRGRLEYDHRDLIPPWDQGLLHGEDGKPTILVSFDRNEGALPSQRTGMVGKDNSRQATTQPVWNSGNQAVHPTFARHMTNGCRHRYSKLPCAQGFLGSNMCLVTGLPGDTSSKPGFHLELSGQITDKSPA